VPVVGHLAVQPAGGSGNILTSGLLASALVGLAAALLGVDKAFGFSSGWARYVLAATEIRKRLETFRMDWTALSASAGANPTPDQVAALIQKAKEFRVGAEDVVGQETKDWVTEFQNNLAQLEKDVKLQLEMLRTQVEKQEAAAQPGSLELTVTDADKTQGFAFTVSLAGPDGPVISDDKVTNSKTWVRTNLKPGQYTLRLNASSVPGAGAAAPAAISKSAIVAIKAGEPTRQSISIL